ncbi:MAG: short-chain dehydrogenase [Chloroflexi bacterium]|nr:short-chain dehydrogenase [Chloroflexota bacterium]
MSTTTQILPTATALPEKVALITGAARGIGAAIAVRLARDGITVALADIRLAAVEQLAEEIRQSGGRAVAFGVDLAGADDIAALEVSVRATLGQIDILVNNAGIIQPKGFADSTVEEWDRLMAVNLRAVFLLCRAALPELRRRHGAIINIASTAGIRAQADNGPYCVAKSGVIMLTQALAQELLADGVRVNCVCPGAVDTPLMKEYVHARGMPESLDELAGTGMLLPPEDVASVVAFLAGDGSRSVTGHITVVDRGALIAG